MSKGKGMPGEKDPFKSLDEDFKDAAAAMDESQLRAKLADVTLNQLAVLEAKDEDPDLKKTKEAYDVAGESYKAMTKMNKLRSKFLRRCLGDKGKNTGSF